jgi:hypothetical protein
MCFEPFQPAQTPHRVRGRRAERLVVPEFWCLLSVRKAFCLLFPNESGEDNKELLIALTYEMTVGNFNGRINGVVGTVEQKRPTTE